MPTLRNKETEYELPNHALWAVPFLRAFAKTGNMTEACKLAGVSRQSIYRLRKSDEAFQTAVNQAVEEGADELEGVAKQRAKAGSDVLLMFLLKGLRPEKYRDNHYVVNQNAPTNYTIDLSLPTGDNTPLDADTSTTALLV